MNNMSDEALPPVSQGKRMTSFASVFVHPMIDDKIEIEVIDATDPE